jgi:hypothetical protein
MIDGTQTLGQAFAKMGQQMLSGMESMLQKMLSDWLENHIMQLLIHTQTKQSEVAVDQTTSAEKQAINMQDHMKNIFLAAKEAGANAWKSASAINPLLGAVAAAAAFAGVMAFGAMGSAEGGQYLVPGTQLTMLHAQEMVLPAGIASRMRDVVEGRASGDGGGITVMVNHSVNAVDADSFQKVVRKHGNMIGNEVARALKKKGLYINSELRCFSSRVLESNAEYTKTSAFGVSSSEAACGLLFYFLGKKPTQCRIFFFRTSAGWPGPLSRRPLSPRRSRSRSLGGKCASRIFRIRSGSSL